MAAYDDGDREFERRKIRMLERIGDGLSALCITMFICTALICFYI
jgi:hypothetical protein